MAAEEAGLAVQSRLGRVFDGAFLLGIDAKPVRRHRPILLMEGIGHEIPICHEGLWRLRKPAKLEQRHQILVEPTAAQKPLQRLSVALQVIDEKSRMTDQDEVLRVLLVIHQLRARHAGQLDRHATGIEHPSWPRLGIAVGKPDPGLVLAPPHENALAQVIGKVFIHLENRAHAAVVESMRVPARRAASFLEMSGDRALDAFDQLVCILLLERPAALVIAFAEDDIEIRLGVLLDSLCHGSDFHGGFQFGSGRAAAAGFAQRIERFHRLELPHPGALAACRRNGGFVAGLNL